jgi:hypothetical protein
MLGTSELTKDLKVRIYFSLYYISNINSKNQLRSISQVFIFLKRIDQLQGVKKGYLKLGGTTLTNNEIKFGKRQINLKVFPIRPA